ncbi:hypothetical protein ACGFNP_58880 [Nonomuraea sp. NPDC049269]|uniref:hypothetical protein n=1 Tax=Nonomuraea sp. NPDC049269 TaxID=3364349 RepID=UPI00371BA3A0
METAQPLTAPTPKKGAGPATSSPGTVPPTGAPIGGHDFLMSEDQGLTGGSSGGPWFQNFNATTSLGNLNSINSFTYSFAPNLMFGPYFGSEAKAVYQAAQSTSAL